MNSTISDNTKAILLLTAPLLPGSKGATPGAEVKPLTPGEYKCLARHLREIQRQPADFISSDAAEILHACQHIIDESRLQRLLGRGFLLSQVIEHWQARAIWVVSRADADYPRRLKKRLREDAPAVLYGSGDMGLLETGGIAVVGSRQVDDALIDYTRSIGQLAARAGRTLVSGGAKGIDLAAMRGALEAGGKVCGVLANSLEKTTMNRENRNLLIESKIVLISPCDPSAGFNVGNAMQRNKLIYALAETSLVVNSDLNKGGTWAGAIEQLCKFKFVPVFVRSTGEASEGLDALRRKGALPWPNPHDADSFAEVFTVQAPPATPSPQVGFSLFDGTAAADTTPLSPVTSGVVSVPTTEREPSTPADVASDIPPSAAVSEEPSAAAPEVVTPAGGIKESPQPELTPAEVLFSGVRKAIQQLLSVPLKDTEVAVSLDVSNAQAKVWLQRLVEDGVVQKQNKPVHYVVKNQTSLFGHDVHDEYETKS